MSGSGIGINNLTSSNIFEAIDQDGYQHRTAWAAAGNAVLFVDPNSLNTIRDADQYIFTDWDPSATTDMQALRDVFDTNHDGVLDARDAAFGQFKLMVTNADGTTSVETLAQAGIASIDLTDTTVTQAFADGSSIDGETTFTRSDGSTGTVAAVTYAADVNGYAVQNTTTANADGSTTVDNRALNADGSLNNDTSSTTSADGTSRTISYDNHGIGVIDHTQTDDTVANGDGSRTLSISDYDGQGQLTGSTVTTTSADGTMVSIARDLTGGGVVDQTETRQTGADGSVTDTLADVSANGTMIDQIVTIASADGLGKLTEVDSTGQVDANGGDVFDRTTQDTTVVNADGSRTETISTVNADQSQVSGSVIVTSADALTRTSSIDFDGDLTTDRVVVSQTTDNPDGSVTTTTTTSNGDQSAVLGTTATTLSADGLSKTTQVDMDGDGVFDRTTSDITTTNDNGGQTEDVTVSSADGTLLSEVLTARSTNGVSRSTITYDGQGDVLSSDAIDVGPQGATGEKASSFGIDGTLLGHTEKTTSADGLTTTTQTDNSGDGTFDRVVVDQTIENGDATATEVVGTRSADGTLLGRTVTYTSADGLTVVTQVDSTGALNPDGTGIFDRTTTDATSYADDGSRIRAVTVNAADGTLLSSVTIDTSADRQSYYVTTDANGAGFTTTFEQVNTAPDGTTSDKIVDLNPDGSHVDGVVRTTSADGLTITTRIDASGTGTFNRVTTDDTTIGDDGLRTETVTNMGNDGTVVGQTMMVSQVNGELSTLSVDTAGDGTFDRITTMAKSYNADGGTTVTAVNKAADGTVRDTTTTITSGNGLSTEVDNDLDGDGAPDLTTTSAMAYAANGDVTMTVTDNDANGLRDKTDTTVSDNGRTTVSDAAYYGSVTYTTTDLSGVSTDGSRYDDLLVYDQAGSTLKETLTSTSGNGLSKTVQVDLNGANTFDISMADDTVLDDDGGRTETMTSSGSAGLNSQTVVRTSGDGLSKTVQSDVDGNGTVDTVTQDDTTLGTNGSRHEVYTQTNQDLSLRDSTIVDTSADGKTVTIARVLGTDGSQAETIHRGIDGTVTDALSDTDGTGMALGGETVTTSANGLVKTATYMDAAGDVQDTQTDTRVLKNDGSTTEQFSDVDSNAGVTAVFTTTTSGNGLYRHTDANFNGLLSDYSADDYTTPETDGTTHNDIVVSNTNGSERDERFSTVSADGLATTSATDETGSGNFTIVVYDTKNTDGSETKQTTVLNSDTGAQDRQDTVTTSTDGRTTTLQSARDGDTTVRYTEATTVNPDGTISDKSQFTSGTLAPSWTQIRSQTLDTTGGQTVVISDYDANGGLADQASTTVSGNGLVIQTAIDTTGSGTNDLIRTDSTVVNADGSKLETIQKTKASGVINSGPGTMGYGRTVSTSADGLTVTTATDDDGNGISEKSETSVRGIDGSLTDTVTFNDNSTDKSVMAQAVDGSTSAGIVKITSADGLMVTTKVGDIVTQRTYVASSNGSYKWTQNANGIFPLPSASHNIDVNGVDTWTSSYIPDVQTNPVFNTNVTTTIQIDTAKEKAAVAQANAIYQTLLDRPMMDAEQETLIQYIKGGILDQQALAKSLIALAKSGASSDLDFIQTSYENDFGHDASASDTAAYLKELQSGDRSQTQAEVAVDITEKAVNEQAGNGLLALLPGGPQATPMTVTLISPQTAAATDTGANYAAFANAIGKPSGNLTPGQISQFGTLTGDPNAASAPQINFASASSSTSGQGTAVPGFFSATPGSTAKAPSGGAAGPLVVNLAGGKVHTTDVATSLVSFDDIGRGAASTTAWTTANEGFLVLDPQGVKITDGSSMIPTFSALATDDANGDGTLTAAEADQAGVKIWVDANADGIDQAGEVESLSQAGIASINLKDATTGSYDNGNILAADSSVTFANGTTGDVADAWLAYGGALAQGAVYQFGDDIVTRAADGTASELLYGTGETVDAGATGLSKVVDAGSNNVLQAGTGAIVTLSGAAGDRLVGGSGADTLLAIGDGETVTTGTGTNTVYVSGATTSVDASLGTSTISLDGANDSIIGATASTTIDVTKGTGATIAATGSKITIEGGIGAEISGSADAITAAGKSIITLDAANSTLVSDAASTVALNGSNDTLTLDRGSSVSVAGSGETIALTSGTVSLASNASAKLTGNADFATQAAGSNLTITGTDGSVDVTGTGAATALDLGGVVLEDGSSDTLTGTGDQVVQGKGTTLSLTGTNATLVVTGTGNQSTLSDARVTIQGAASSQVTGSRDVITAGPTGLSGTLVGSDDRVTISGTGGQVSLAGLRDDVAMDNGSLQLASGSLATLEGSGDTATLGDGATLTVTGNVDHVTESGAGAVLTVTGDGTVATATGNNDTMTLTGTSVSAIAHGDHAIVNVTGTSDAIYVDGSQDAVTFSGTGATISAKNSSSVKILDGSTATVDGNLNTVSIGSSTGVVLKGTGDALTASGANDFIVLSSSAETVSASSGTVILAKQIGVSVTGDGDQVSVDNGDTLTLSGNRDSITINGNGNTLAISGSGDTVSETGRSNNAIKLGGGSTTVTAGSVSVVQAANGNLSVYGGLASTAVTTSSSSPSIALGNGNTVSSGATPATVTGYGANGLTSWQDIFNTMSGALKETDQYQYNSSNALLEIDRYNGSNVKTEADLYDPKTSSEIGSYLYASNGHVNEVVDLLHNHDWLSQSNGTYKDKTSGAVSKTQPTLR